MYLGYVEGIWPPGQKSPVQAAAAFAGLLRAHALAASALREHDRGAQVGVAVNVISFEPASRLLLTDWLAARVAAEAFDWAFYDSVRAGRIRFHAPGFPSLDEPVPGLTGSTDWLGVNYYRRERIHFTPSTPAYVGFEPGMGPLSDVGWGIHPEGLLRLLRIAWSRYRLPVYVTENGIADAAGSMRSEFIRGHAYAMSRAISEGIPVRGYFHWSLTDNFEWTQGFAPRFGLFRVDYKTLERRPAGGSEAFRTLAP
jgi:beta-glucosidase